MGRSLSVLLLFIFVAGCATTAQLPTQPAQSRVQYLDGVETQFARRLDGLSSEQRLPSDSVMRNAVIAGDEELWIAATVFRRGDYYGMDMIVLNRGDELIELHKDDVRLVDTQGRWLTGVADFDGARALGLRAKAGQGSARFIYDAPAQPSFVGDLSMDFEGSSTKTRHPTPSATVPVGVSPNPAWRADFEPVDPATPERVRVGGESSRAFWTYWQGDEVAFPLTAFVMLDDRHMVFQFDL